MSHTPTPWKLIDEGIIAAQSPTPVKPGGQPNAALLRTPVIALPPVDYPDYSQFKAGDWDANAAHIVRCVNTHDQLVAALSTVTSSLIACVFLLEHGGEKAAASSKMYEQMMKDHKKAIDVGSNLLALAAAEKGA